MVYGAVEYFECEYCQRLKTLDRQDPDELYHANGHRESLSRRQHLKLSLQLVCKRVLRKLCRPQVSRLVFQGAGEEVQRFGKTLYLRGASEMVCDL
jgi:hypothetical protein